MSFSLGPPGIPQKRTPSEPVIDIFNRLKRTKLVTTAPSDAAKAAIYESNQNKPSEKIFDDRPVPDADIPPISLLYEGFGHFLDIMNGRDDVPGLDEVDVPKLQRAVDDLASKMTGYFDSEDDRRDAALPCLTRIFSARTGIKIPRLHAAAIGSARSDGHNTAAYGPGSMVVKFKNEITGINAHPHIEAACYFAHLNVKEIAEDKAREQLYLRWRVPCVGLTIVGELNISLHFMFCFYISMLSSLSTIALGLLH
jgi:hypothetical protein